MRKVFILLALVSSFGAKAQTVTFDKNDYASVGVYDTWEESPFRTGVLKGNCHVAKNPFRNTGNDSRYVLGFQRSRYGSNTFGARIDLKEPFALTSKVQYVHVKIHKPKAGRVMLIGLGKRTERVGQSRETEQFWVLPMAKVTTDQWNDAVFPIKGHDGIDIYTLVVVPDCESTHHLPSDFICYIDDIIVSKDATPRIALVGDKENGGEAADSTHCTIHDSNRNGEVLSQDGRQLSSLLLPAGKEFTIRMQPERGFTYDGVLIRSGKKEVRIGKEQFKDDCYTIPATMMTGDVEVEGLFVEKK